MASVFSTMGIAKIIVKFYPVTTKWRFKNSFSGTMFNRHRIQFESGALNTDSSNIYFFLPSTTNKVEDINKYMGSVNLVPIEIKEGNFEFEGGKFHLSKLDFDNPKKHKIREAVLKILRKS